MDAATVIARARRFGYFVNGNTLEPELFTGGLAEAMQETIEEELSIGDETRETLQGWVDDPDEIDEDALIGLIERIGKGRFAQALAERVTADDCPDYIRHALEHIRDAVA
jgi:putative ATP-dependent endonuclease of OLD family